MSRNQWNQLKSDRKTSQQITKPFPLAFVLFHPATGTSRPVVAKVTPDCSAAVRRARAAWFKLRKTVNWVNPGNPWWFLFANSACTQTRKVHHFTSWVVASLHLENPAWSKSRRASSAASSASCNCASAEAQASRASWRWHEAKCWSKRRMSKSGVWKS